MSGCRRACTVGLLAMAVVNPHAQPRDDETPAAWVAFRLDATRLVAVLSVRDAQGPRPAAPVLTPVAKYGFPVGGAAPELVGAAPMPVTEGDPWVVHVAPGRSVPATAERVVAGDPGCQSAIGVVLRLPPPDAPGASTRGSNYFIATRGAGAPARPALSTLGAVPTPSTPQFDAAVRRQLGDLLRESLPRVREDAAPDVSRMAASPVEYHRAWASGWPEIDAALGRGAARLRHDVQSYRLAAGEPPVHFVRAEWLVAARQGFAASVWMRGPEPFEVVDRWLTPASWLRMFEFQGEIRREQLGLVLGVFDVDDDGRAEVLMAVGGYESMALRVRRYTRTGLIETSVGYGVGC